MGWLMVWLMAAPPGKHYCGPGGDKQVRLASGHTARPAACPQHGTCARLACRKRGLDFNILLSDRLIRISPLVRRLFRPEQNANISKIKSEITSDQSLIKNT